MRTLYCHMCGGVIHDPSTIEYLPPHAAVQIALTHPGPCTCARPVVHEDPPVIESQPNQQAPGP